MARRIAEEAIATCPDNPDLYVLMAVIHNVEFTLGLGKPPLESIERSIEMLQKAIAMDDSIPEAHSTLSLAYAYDREYDKAIAEGERGVALDPGASFTYACYAQSLNVAGRSEEAIPMFQKAIRLNPFGSSPLYLNFGIALRIVGRYEEAVSALKKAIQLAPDNYFAHIHLTATYSLVGREKEARAEAAEVLRINPKFSVDRMAKTAPYKDQSEMDKTINALRKAGLK